MRNGLHLRRTRTSGFGRGVELRQLRGERWPAIYFRVNMTARSKAFEQHVERIHALLEGSDALVTWNDRVPDPDNPDQPRQIDISIRRDGKLTLVECRLRKGREDVQWIEELHGRRKSLRAHSVIAVASGGFTVGAIRKARRFKIHLRDIASLTDEEILHWGRSIALTISYYLYSELELAVRLPTEAFKGLNLSLLCAELGSYPGLDSLFEAAAKLLDAKNPLTTEPPVRANFAVRGTFDGLRLCDHPVLEVKLSGRVEFVSRKIKAPAVVGYGKPNEHASGRQIKTANYPMGQTAITHYEDAISVVLDLSALRLPRNALFRYFRIESERIVNHEWLELLSPGKIRIRVGEMALRVWSGPDENSAAFVER